MLKSKRDPNHENGSLPIKATKYSLLETPSDVDVTEALDDVGNVSVQDGKSSCCSRNKAVLLGVVILVMVVALIASGIMVSRVNKSDALSAGIKCHEVNDLSYGKVMCINMTADTGAKCYFACNDGYKMVGANSSTCIGTKWTSKKPSCEAACELPKVANGTWLCSNQTFENSICTLTCQNNYHIEGHSTVTCLEDGIWSSRTSKCSCPKCRIGEYCAHSISWQTIRDQLRPMEIHGTISVHYVGYHLDCSNRLIIPSFKYAGECMEKTTGTQIKCKAGFYSPSGAAEAAVAEMIRHMVANHDVREPCDVETMSTRC